MVTRKEIVDEARTWVGVKWRHQGRTREHGIDCVGLPIVVGLRLGLHGLNPSDYPRRPDGSFIAAFEEVADSVRVQDAQEGDVLVFLESKHPCHCGIRSTLHGLPAVIHAYAGRGVVVEQTLEEAKSIIGKPIRAFVMPSVT